MSIMPAEGWGVQSHSSRQAINCPNCQSDAWKTAGLVHQEGLSVSRFQTRGTVVGVGRAGLRNGQFIVGGGVQRSNTLGIAQSALSRMAAPPSKRIGSVIALGMLCFFCTFSAINGIATYGFSIGFVVIGTFAAFFLWACVALYTKRQKAYEEALAAYQNIRVCQRCGAFYTP